MATIIIEAGNEKKRERALYVIGELSIDRPWAITIEPFKPQRTNTQNARLWALHSRAAEHTGYSSEEMHEFALCRHFGYVEKQVPDLFTGEMVTKRIPNKRSSARDTKEFAQFMEATEAFYISEFGVFLGDEG